MKTDTRKLAAACAVAALLLGLAVAGPVLAQTKIAPHQCPVCLALVNSFVRADVATDGAWVIGTTGGDPQTPDDDRKRLLYGWQANGTSLVGSSYTTVRVIGPRGSRDILPKDTDVASQAAVSDSVRTVWRFAEPCRVAVTETVRLERNPFSGQADTAVAEYAAGNVDTVTCQVGVRVLLDVMVGTNDGAPYQVPGVGAISRERAFAGAEVPPFWLAFESDTHDPRLLRSIGILDSPGLERPDRFVIAAWREISGQAWDYAVDVTRPITSPSDSAVALYWEPEAIAPGTATRLAATGYGLAGQGGGNAFLAAENTRCGAVVPVSMFVSNFSTDPLEAGQAVVSLPPGLALAAGETAARPIGPIAAGGTASVVWRVEVGAGVRGPVDLAATATFPGGARFTAARTIQVECDLPTATASPTASATPSPTTMPTATPTVTPSPMPTPTTDTGARACAFILDRVPPQVVSYALANPQTVMGWNQLLRPGMREGPFNPRRRWLSILNIAAPYHQDYNPLVFKVGCP